MKISASVIKVKQIILSFKLMKEKKITARPSEDETSPHCPGAHHVQETTLSLLLLIKVFSPP